MWPTPVLSTQPAGTLTHKRFNMDRRVEISAPAGTYTFVCNVPGHDDMVGTLIIEG